MLFSSSPVSNLSNWDLKPSRAPKLNSALHIFVFLLGDLSHPPCAAEKSHSGAGSLTSVSHSGLRFWRNCGRSKTKQNKTNLLARLDPLFGHKLENTKKKELYNYSGDSDAMYYLHYEEERKQHVCATAEDPVN